MEIIEQAPKRAIVVTPHPDDCEGGCGGTMAKCCLLYTSDAADE